MKYIYIYIYETNEAKSNISKIGMKHHKTSCNSLIATILGYQNESSSKLQYFEDNMQ